MTGNLLERLRVRSNLRTLTLPYSHTPILALPSFPPSKPVIPVYVDHECKNNYHSYYLCVFQHFLTWFTSGNHFQYCEKHMSPIQGWYGKNIHKCECNGEKCGDHPERLPVPHRWEHRTHRFESTHRFVGFSFRRKYFFKLPDITLQFFSGKLYTCRKGFKKTVLSFFQYGSIPGYPVCLIRIHLVKQILFYHPDLRRHIMYL